MKKIKALILPIISILFIIYNLNRLEGLEEKLLNFESKEPQGRSLTTLVLKGAGLKKVGADYYFLNQVLEVGSNNPNTSEITQNLILNYEKTFYLNPYLVGNYHLTGSTLGFIKLFKDTIKAKEVLLKGIDYNPNNETLKLYYTGLLASENKNLNKAYENLKKILVDTNNIYLLKILTELSQQVYYKNPTKKGFLEYLYFGKRLSLISTGSEKENLLVEMDTFIQKEAKKYNYN